MFLSFTARSPLSISILYVFVGWHSLHTHAHTLIRLLSHPLTHTHAHASIGQRIVCLFSFFRSFARCRLISDTLAPFYSKSFSASVKSYYSCLLLFLLYSHSICWHLVSVCVWKRRQARVRSNSNNSNNNRVQICVIVVSVVPTKKEVKIVHNTCALTHVHTHLRTYVCVSLARDSGSA